MSDVVARQIGHSCTAPATPSRTEGSATAPLELQPPTAEPMATARRLQQWPQPARRPASD
eukprot:CAMPEP_0180472286 /NCGR_PEP_ID=MMETSP1036_2-20121128/29560_1 /TAXON_ID=632150 /ORGANISM="Azadinium spinosum, Strain 3D9" /LENGTH=59 /DNA_ID=CAMNT_0022479521 /DNA_START=656 /DNA_END=832 /DNA_ORIENTATION=-